MSMLCDMDSSEIFRIIKRVCYANTLTAVIFTLLCLLLNECFLFDGTAKVFLSSILGSFVYLFVYVLSNVWLVRKNAHSKTPEADFFNYIIVFIIKYVALITICTIILKFIPIKHVFFFLAFFLQIVMQYITVVTYAYRIKQE